jgi:hypothetical protein
VTSPASAGSAARGVVRLLNTSGGRVLCLAGQVDETVVAAFLQRYGREPARVDRIEAGSVTSLSAPALDLVLDHLHAAELAGRAVPVLRSPLVERLLGSARAAQAPVTGAPTRA